MTPRFEFIAALPQGRREAALSFMFSEALKGRHELGFLPKSGVEHAAELGRVGIVTVNDDLVGFAVFGGGGSYAKIYQTWVREDARLLLNGRCLVDGVAAWAWTCFYPGISLWCAEDLAAMSFWQSLGFQKRDQRPGGRWSKRTHRRFVLPISRPPESLLQACEALEVEGGPKTPRTSRRHAAMVRRRASQQQTQLFATT